jgi:hypothetical protein
MTISVSGTAITFNDATTQTTAASPSSYAGAGGQVFTSGGTFTIPTGVTALKVTVVGGGGGGYGSSGCCPAPGGTGGTSSVSSGTQTISTISATGGNGSTTSVNVSGGLGSGGTINMRGGAGSNYAAFATPFGTNGINLQSPLYGGGGGAGGSGGSAIKYLTGLTAGNTLSVTVGTGGSSVTIPGATGIVVFEW